MEFTKKLKIGTVCLLLAFGLAACKDSLTDYNNNPNAPSEVPGKIILPRAIQTSMDRLYSMSGLNGYVGGIWAQQYAKIQYTDEDRYDFSGRIGLVEDIWEDFYAETLTDLQQLVMQAQNGEYTDQALNDNQIAIAKILMAWNYQVATDIWGPIPFTDALKGNQSGDNQVLSPSYDSQEAVYDGIITMLDDALGTMQVDGPSPFGSQDLIYGGDMTRWRKLANSLKLRVYMRQSEVAPSKAESGIQSVYSTGNFFTSNDDNAKLEYLSYPDNNPVNQFFGYEDGGREDHKISKTMTDTLKGLDDPRLRIYAMPTESDSVWNWPESEQNMYPNHQWPDSTYVGVINGSENNYIPLSEASNIGAYFLAPKSPGFIMGYPEVKFILAEAQVRGWLSPVETGKTEEQMYNEAVEASMMMYNSSRLTSVIGSFPGDAAYTNQNMHVVELPQGITDQEATDYLDTGSPAEFPAAGTMQDKIDAIALQKWIGMYGQGLESWSEWRRLGEPQLTPGPEAVLNSVPVRVFYPPVEQSVNQSNYQDAVNTLGGDDDMLTPLWWDE